MERKRNLGKRAYRSPQRSAQAASTRDAVVRAALQLFEDHGWTGTRLSEVAARANVSQKTVEAIFGTKGALLRMAVDYAIRGDLDPRPMPQREQIARMEAAEDAAAMLRLHAAHLRAINGRSARIAAAVEQAAPTDAGVAGLWEQMNQNRRYAVRWASRTLLAKPGRKADLTRSRAHAYFWVALDWGTYRTLTDHANLTAKQYENWLYDYYRAVFLE